MKVDPLHVFLSLPKIKYSSTRRHEREFNCTHCVRSFSFHACFFVGTWPTRSDQNDLNAPDVIIMSFQLVNINFPEQLEQTITISVPKFTTFYHMVPWAVTHSQKKEYKYGGTKTPLVLDPK